jgi:hypothetical protein
MIFFRRTLVPGLMIFLGVMTQVLMLNYLYGVAVKTFSTTLFIMGLYLLSKYIPKLIDFLLLHKPSKIEIPALRIGAPWKKKVRIILKYGYFAFALILITLLQIQLHSRLHNHLPIAIEGAYDVHVFETNGVKNTDFFDEERWNQVVVNNSIDGLTSSGHIAFGTTKRELATFEIDSLNQVSVTFDRDTSIVFKGNHQLSEDSFIWTGTIGNDSIRMVLKKNERELVLRDSPFKLIFEPGEGENLRTR